MQQDLDHNLLGILSGLATVAWHTVFGFWGAELLSQFSMLCVRKRPDVAQLFPLLFVHCCGCGVAELEG